MPVEFRFFGLLAEHYDVDHEEIEKASAALASAEGDQERRRARRRLRDALVAPRVQLLTQFNSLEHGVKFLVDMRADMLEALPEHPELKGLEEDLQNLLRGWFDIGFLEMAQITFNSPASLLEKLIEYEAVHEIRSWTDLKNRLDSDRRCFSFVHPNMPDEPLIFVEVALVNGISGNVQSLLDEDAPPMDPASADTAIFYSISNCQKGLAGVGFGDFLIKRVVDRLSQRLPNLKDFATLSPMPGFRRWLEGCLAGEDEVLTDAERKVLLAATGAESGNAALLAFLWDEDWWRDDKTAAPAEAALMRLGALYLTAEKDGRGLPLDPVARFHLNNGARVERLNWLGNRSRAGIRASAGLMVNYLYKLDQIERNHELFRGDGRIAVSAEVRRLAKSA
ncbi:MAG: malonyl-CoA decarboxylase domain-containing protein [Minwuia sp.]|uniref:malonyl-CoA decarboxylase domain-containing protein n=1 Tax=Minwuia sp. TaxID=2493630 RepID=UPI003A83C535